MAMCELLLDSGADIDARCSFSAESMDCFGKNTDGGTVPYKAIFWGDIPLHRPYIGLICGRYLQFRILKWSLIKSG